MKRFFALFLALIACGFAGVAGCDKSSAATDDQSTSSDGLDKLFAVTPFTLTNDDGQPFGTEQLKGKTWIATLFFSECPGPCPMMQGHLHEIQDAINDPNVCMVSVSVDPKNDTPAKLKAYADRMDADPKRWFFLSGSPDGIQKVADDLKLGFEPAHGNTPIMHSTQFLLIDKTGEVRGIYSTQDEGSMKQLQIDAAKLSKES